MKSEPVDKIYLPGALELRQWGIGIPIYSVLQAYILQPTIQPSTDPSYL
jgi:hypothetical protein